MLRCVGWSSVLCVVGLVAWNFKEPFAGKLFGHFRRAAGGNMPQNDLSAFLVKLASFLRWSGPFGS